MTIPELKKREMEVTRDDFMEVYLPRLQEALGECDFVSIDTEFTG